MRQQRVAVVTEGSSAWRPRVCGECVLVVWCVTCSRQAHSLEFLRDIMHLRPRSNTIGAMLRVRNVLAQAVHGYFQQQGFIQVHTPILTRYGRHPGVDARLEGQPCTNVPQLPPIECEAALPTTGEAGLSRRATRCVVCSVLQ